MQPLERGAITFVDLGAMLVLAVTLIPLARTGFVVSRLEGAVLMSCYAGYVTWLVMV